MPTTIQNGVMIGKDGALFLAHGGHGVLRFATGEARPSPQSIANMAQNLEDRRRAAREGGFRFASIIAPEKYRVYPEWCPVELPFSLARHYIDGGCTGVIDPVDTLRSAKPGPSYYLTDTHWNPYGRIAIARCIAEEAGIAARQLDAASDLAYSCVSVSGRAFVGDLATKLDPSPSEPELVLTPPFPRRQVENGISHVSDRPANEGRMIVAQTDAPTASDKRLLIFGDSYLIQSLPALSFFFRTIVLCRTRWFHPEMVSLVQPDMVVTQQAERYLSHVSPDRTAPAFFMIPYLLGRHHEMSVENAEFIASVLSCGRDVDFNYRKQ